ncbi:nuclear transport factor 2 family protein [Flavivirga algicola]|uniref:Nuclear transport factor 2 family protein n=1 Tax=Flavivirga algicola TaxID=2729136 RepID=A0ABX1S344_9FLAO|nr:nuclear transport factor 2 family protein [Flavivirga algicola]NMH89796.1 nuclear transport factor 2 family protein [Flavivirga algicola]
MNRTELIEKKQIVEMEQDILNAMKTNDVQKLDGLLHEALFFTIPSGQTITKAMDLETYSSGNMKISEILYSEQDINIIGDNAIVSAVVEMKGTYFDYSLNGTYKVIRIWKLFHDTWKVIAGSSVVFDYKNNS